MTFLAAPAGPSVIIDKLHAATSCLVAGLFAALFIFITGRRLIDRDMMGTLFAAGLSAGFIWATIRTFRRWQRM